MIVFELTQTENNPAYQKLQAENGSRQYGFLSSMVDASLAMNRPFLSQHVIKSLNFHAITCLHISAGEYRPHDVVVGASATPGVPPEYTPPRHYQVRALMDDFVNQINRNWDDTDAVTLATYVLWRLNNIHPFVNGNGRTARAACYYVLCLKSGGLLPGFPILPELIKRDRDEYCEHLQVGHDTAVKGGPNLSGLHKMLVRLIQEQTASAQAP